MPGPGEFGHDTWEGDSWQHGGAPVWTHPAIESHLGMIYVPTGNASPDTHGTRRGSDNLFSASIVALDLKGQASGTSRKSGAAIAGAPFAWTATPANDRRRDTECPCRLRRDVQNCTWTSAPPDQPGINLAVSLESGHLMIQRGGHRRDPAQRRVRDDLLHRDTES